MPASPSPCGFHEAVRAPSYGALAVENSHTPWLHEHAGGLDKRPWLQEGFGCEAPPDLCLPEAKRRRMLGSYSQGPHLEAPLLPHSTEAPADDAEPLPGLRRHEARFDPYQDLGWECLASLPVKRRRLAAAGEEEELHQRSRVLIEEVSSDSAKGGSLDEASTSCGSDEEAVAEERVCNLKMLPQTCAELMPHRGAAIWACIYDAFASAGSLPCVQPSGEPRFTSTNEVISLRWSNADCEKLARAKPQSAVHGLVMFKQGKPVAVEPLSNEEPDLPGLVVFGEAEQQQVLPGWAPSAVARRGPWASHFGDQHAPPQRQVFIEELGEESDEDSDEAISEMQMEDCVPMDA